MNKKELTDALKNFSDDTEIVLWHWDGQKSTYEYLNQCCGNDPSNPGRAGLFAVSNSYCEFKTKKGLKKVKK